MKLDAKLAKLLRIPTRGMKPHEAVPLQAIMLNRGLEKELTLTQGFLNQGQLCINHNEPTRYMCFIQRSDGEIFVAPAASNGTDYLSVKDKLNENINAEIILSNVAREDWFGTLNEGFLNPRYAALEFLAQHHPRADARVAAIKALMWLEETDPNERAKELADAQAITSQHN
jgi:hypothetical protein